ncbi:MAG TPA: hypothetical protein VFY29_01675 [Terriglobia bacterium]|nr:hypothetical protein [Terriglobia bacterium]
MSWALFARKERWGLTLRGRIAALILLAAGAWVARNQAYAFLAVNAPLSADLLVVEGWFIERNAALAAAEFKRGQYHQMLVVQASYEGERPGYRTGRDAQDYSAQLLARYGVPRSAFGVLSYPAVERDRTYHGALAAREWMRETGRSEVSFNVATLGAHARRSRLLFQKAYGRADGIGVVALVDPMFDPARWWRNSEGVRDVIGESLAYGYALYFAWFN